MLKIYTWLVARIEVQEVRLASKLKERLVSQNPTGLFSFGLIFIDLELFLLGLTNNLARFLIVLFIDSGHGFNTVFKQQTLYICPYSYTAYKTTQKRLRTFSFGTLATMVVAVGIVSLVMNLLFSDKLTGWAQTYNWTQDSWSLGASSTAVATHANQVNPGNTPWQRFSSSTSNIAASSTGITLTASSVVAFNHTLDGDFTGTKSSTLYVTGGSIRLVKPFGASCTTDIECTDGLGGTYGGWCDTVGGNICRNPWRSAPGSALAYTLSGVFTGALASGECQSILNSIKVARKDAGKFLWSVNSAPYNNTACSSISPNLCSNWSTNYCGGSCASNEVSTSSVYVNATNYPAQAACLAIGGRLPTMAEYACIYANITSYNSGGAFASGIYWSATEYNGTFTNGINFTNGDQGGWWKYDNYNVRCVK